MIIVTGGSGKVGRACVKDLMAHAGLPQVGREGEAAFDLAAFRRWKSFDEAVSYDWGLAAWRWFQGAVVGIAMGFGLGGVQ